MVKNTLFFAVNRLRSFQRMHFRMLLRQSAIIKNRRQAI
jgi:hypothetical protein